MEFECEPCNYKTNDQSNFVKHNKSKKHIAKKEIQKNVKIVTNEYICVNCERQFSSPSNVARHEKACNKRIQMPLKMELLEQKIDHKDEMMEQKDQLIAQLKLEVAHLKSIVNTAETIVKSSVSGMTYAMKNYGNAPVLEKFLEYEDINCVENNDKFVRILVHEYKHKHLDAYIGDFIIKSHKKDNPSEQSIWNSDTNRLTYLIRDAIANKVDWRIDKKGVKTNEFIIVPVIDYVDKEVRSFISTLRINYDNVAAIKEGIELVNVTAKILKIIETESLNNDVLKYIAPYFYLNKNCINE